MRHPAVVLGLAAVLSAVIHGQETNYSAPGRLVDIGGRNLHLLWKLSEEDIRSAYPLPATARLPRPTRTGQPFDRLPAYLQPVRLWLDVRLWESLDPTTMSPESSLSWRREFLREFEETEGNRQPLGSLPVVVISSGPIASETERGSRNTASARLDFLSSNVLHIEATGSGHETHLFQPERVIEGISRAVLALRTRASLVER